MVLTEVIPKGQQNPIVPSDVKFEGYSDPFINFELNVDHPGRVARDIALYTRDSISNVDMGAK